VTVRVDPAFRRAESSVGSCGLKLDAPPIAVAEPELGEWQPVEVVAMPKPDVRPLPAVETLRLEEPEQGYSQPKTLQWHREG
jgi:hypothetical protein